MEGFDAGITFADYVPVALSFLFNPDGHDLTELVIDPTTKLPADPIETEERRIYKRSDFGVQFAGLPERPT